MRISDWSSDVCSSDVMMEGECAGSTVGNVMLQGGDNGAKGQLRPWNVIHAEEGGLEAFGTGVQLFAEYLCKIEKMHLLCMWHIDQGIQWPQANLCPRFFLSFAHGALSRGFAKLHESRRQGPGVVPGLYRATA